MSDYPSDEELAKIASWKVTGQKDFLDLMEYVHDLWAYAGDGYWSRKGDIFRISTAGWSGNEDIIAALQENTVFWLLYWQQSRRGGHYIFGNFHDCIDLRHVEASRAQGGGRGDYEYSV